MDFKNKIEQETRKYRRKREKRNTSVCGQARDLGRDTNILNIYNTQS